MRFEYNYKYKKEDGLVGCLGILFGWVIICLVGALITGFTLGYAVNFWLLYFHKTTHFSYWAGFLLGGIPFLGLQICWLSVVADIITFILSFFL